MDFVDPPPTRIEPWDLLRCQGCEQLLQADGRARFTDAAIEACRGRCDWVLLARHQAAD